MFRYGKSLTKLVTRQKLHLRFMSQVPTVQETVQHKEKSLREKKVNRRKAAIEPFMKNFFCGKVNTDIIAFPEILSNDELRKLSEFTEPIDKAMDDILKDETDIEDAKLLELLKSFDAFSLNIPIENKGQEFTITEICRTHESFFRNFHIGLRILYILGHGVEQILKYCSNKQKEEYIPRILSGECTPIVCFHEEGISTTNQFKTHAKLNRDKTAWILNGEKVVNKTMRENDILMIVATTDLLNPAGDIVNANTMFIENSNKPGITKVKINDNCYKLIFDNVSIVTDNMLGEQENGLDIYLESMVSSRLSIATVCSTLMKNLLSKLSQTVINAEATDDEMIREKVAETACAAYAMESMLYLTTGLLDGYENPDCVIETSILKVYCTEKCLEHLLSSMHIFGAFNYSISLELKNQIQSMLDFQIFDESNEYLKMLIGMLGVKHAGETLASAVKKVRNPFMFPGFVFKKVWEKKFLEADRPKLLLRLNEYVHPSLEETINSLEYCILKFQYVTEMLLMRHGRSILDKKMEINKLACAAIEIFAMFASVSRASRSYCIGHHNSHLELELADAIVKEGACRARSYLDSIEIGPYNSCDSQYDTFSTQIYESAGEFAEHSLKTNF